MNELIENLEKVLTIDGRGRPKKAQLLLELIAKYGIDNVMEAVRSIGERKAF